MRTGGKGGINIERVYLAIPKTPKKWTMAIRKRFSNLRILLKRQVFYKEGRNAGIGSRSMIQLVRAFHWPGIEREHTRTRLPQKSKR